MGESNKSVELPPEKRIPVDPPVSYGGQSYAELVLREPSAGEIEDCDHLTGTAWTRALVAKVAGVPDKAVRELRIRELNSASEYLTGFTSAVL